MQHDICEIFIPKCHTTWPQVKNPHRLLIIDTIILFLYRGFSKPFLFVAALPCENSTCGVTKPNSTCQETNLHTDSKCECDDGFYQDKPDICKGMLLFVFVGD